jgi:hypothetical protein
MNIMIEGYNDDAKKTHIAVKLSATLYSAKVSVCELIYNKIAHNKIMMIVFFRYVAKGDQ